MHHTPYAYKRSHKIYAYIRRSAKGHLGIGVFHVPCVCTSLETGNPACGATVAEACMLGVCAAQIHLVGRALLPQGAGDRVVVVRDVEPTSLVA